MRRYIQLFIMLAVATLITMSVQYFLGMLWPAMHLFWVQYISFVAIFFLLLSIVLHLATLKKFKK